MIHAYNNFYLALVMRNIAALTDLAVNAEGLDPDIFGKMFADSEVARKIEHGHPDMLAGKSPTEMLSLILGRDVDCIFVPADRTPEYWAGWVLAKAHWELNKTFKEILTVMPLSSLIALYHPYHEADETKTVDIIKERLPKKPPVLKILRRSSGLTQQQLAALSGVSLRSIRAYEQNANDLSNAQGETLQMLAHTLGCRIEELLE